MIHEIDKTDAIHQLTIRIKNLVETLAGLAGNHDNNMNSTDSHTFQRLIMLRADLDTIAAVSGADRVEYDGVAKKFRWSAKDASPDGQWRDLGFAHKSTTWNGLYLEIEGTQSGAIRYNWCIKKDGQVLSGGTCSRVGRMSGLECAKQESMAAAMAYSGDAEDVYRQYGGPAIAEPIRIVPIPEDKP